MRETAMWFQYVIAQERAERLRAEGLAAQRVALLTGRHARPHRLRELLATARDRFAGRAGRRAAQPVAEVLCARAGGPVVGRAG